MRSKSERTGPGFISDHRWRSHRIKSFPFIHFSSKFFPLVFTVVVLFFFLRYLPFRPELLEIALSTLKVRSIALKRSKPPYAEICQVVLTNDFPVCFLITASD